MPLSGLAGNHALKEQLMPRLSGGTLGHAFILSGPAGSGKHALAAILARALVCDGAGTKPCGCCSGCKKALAGSHPDIITVAPLEEGKQITVKQVRDMRADAYIRPNEAARKVYIMEQAGGMKDEAQNAMLKVLEDGPAYAAFLLLADNAGSLLATVRSRCEVLHLMSAGSSVPADEQTLLLADTLVDLWLAGDEAGLMARLIPTEKWERHKFAALLDRMHQTMHQKLISSGDRRRAFHGVQRLEECRRALALNINNGTLYGWLCVGSGE